MPERPAAVDDSPQIDVEYRRSRPGSCRGRSREPDAPVVDEHVDDAVFSNTLLASLLHRFGIGDVGGQAVPGGADQAGERPRCARPLRRRRVHRQPSAPASAKAMAVARPIPLPAPVTRNEPTCERALVCHVGELSARCPPSTSSTNSAITSRASRGSVRGPSGRHRWSRRSIGTQRFEIVVKDAGRETNGSRDGARISCTGTLRHARRYAGDAHSRWHVAAVEIHARKPSEAKRGVRGSSWSQA